MGAITRELRNRRPRRETITLFRLVIPLVRCNPNGAAVVRVPVPVVDRRPLVEGLHRLLELIPQAVFEPPVGFVQRRRHLKAHEAFLIWAFMP